MEKLLDIIFREEIDLLQGLRLEDYPKLPKMKKPIFNAKKDIASLELQINVTSSVDRVNAYIPQAP